MTALLINVQSTSPNDGVTIYGMAVDSSGNCYVTGTQFDSGGHHVAFVAKTDMNGVIQWQRRLTDATSTPNDRGYGIAIDGSGNIYVTGQEFTGTNTNPAFVAKYSSAGVIQWQRTLLDSGSNPGEGAYSVAVDTSANVYVTGMQATSSATPVAFVAKYDTTGALQWQRSLTDAYANHRDYMQGIAVDGSGNVYLTGSQRNSAGNGVVSVVKYSTTAVLQWQRTLTDAYTTPQDVGVTVAVDGSGNIYVGGYTLNAAGNRIAILAQYNNSGVIQWQRTLADAYSSPADQINALVLDTSANIYVSGQQLNSAGDTIAFVAKYSSAGVIQWQRTLTDSTASPYSVGYAIGLDGAGNFYASGPQNGSASNYPSFIFRAPTDGTLTGIYTTAFGSLNYATGTLTDAAGTSTDAAGTLTDAAGTLTDAAGTLTDSLDNLVMSNAAAMQLVMVI